MGLFVYSKKVDPKPARQAMMSSPPIAISVIIPTYNRCAELINTIRSLCRQTISPEMMEVLVVADGCTDCTFEALQTLHTPFLLRVIEQPNQGAGAARNRGATHARGKLLLFLDDDIEATPQLVEAHVRAHQAEAGRVVIGYLPTILAGRNDFFEIQLRAWWDAMFQRMRQPGHRFSYTDLLSGNFSVEADLFKQIGGFQADLRCHEDYEIGVRLLQAGGKFYFAQDAKGYHHERTDLGRSLQRKYQEGIADVVLGRRYPELIPTLLMTRLKRYSLLASRILQIFAFRWPAAGDIIVAFFQRCMIVLEKARLRWPWRRILYGLLGYWYWRGVAQELRSLAEVDLFLKEFLDHAQEEEPDLTIDLEAGLANAERILDACRPTSVRLHYGKYAVGVIPPKPGAEPLQSRHLRYFLAQELTVPLLKALTLEGKLGFPEMTGKILAACEESQSS